MDPSGLDKLPYPSQIPKNWTPDYTHGALRQGATGGSARYTDPKGQIWELDKGDNTAGEGTWERYDHWHRVTKDCNGKFVRSKEHIPPGDDPDKDGYTAPRHPPARLKNPASNNTNITNIVYNRENHSLKYFNSYGFMLYQIFLPDSVQVYASVQEWGTEYFVSDTRYLPNVRTTSGCPTIHEGIFNSGITNGVIIGPSGGFSIRAPIVTPSPVMPSGPIFAY